MKDMLDRDFTIGDQVVYLQRRSTHVHAVVGVVRGLNVIDYTVTLEVLYAKNKDDIGRMTAPIREHNVLLLKEVDRG